MFTRMTKVLYFVLYLYYLQVSYVAHLAGFVSGLLVGLLVLRNLRKLVGGGFGA